MATHASLLLVTVAFSLVILATPATGSIRSGGWGSFRDDSANSNASSAADDATRRTLHESEASRSDSVAGDFFRPGKLGYAPDYFERTYPGGWFTSPPILDSRVESSALFTLISARTRTHVPAYVSAYTVTVPRPLVYFTVLWQPNAQRLSWQLVYNLNGQQLQQALHDHIADGYKPAQLESYWVPDAHGLYYAALFLADAAWPAGASTRVEAVFGVPNDARYCCGPASRWLALQRQGFTPLSVSVTEVPSGGGVTLYVADVWNDAQAGSTWQGGIGKSAAQLQSALASLLPPLSPVFLKAYWDSDSRQLLYAYLAKPLVSSSGARPASAADVSRSSSRAVALSRPVLTTEVSRSAFELLTQAVRRPPLFVSAAVPLIGGNGGVRARGGVGTVNGTGRRSDSGRRSMAGVGAAADGRDTGEIHGDRRDGIGFDGNEPGGEAIAAGEGEVYVALWQMD